MRPQNDERSKKCVPKGMGMEVFAVDNKNCVHIFISTVVTPNKSIRD